MGAVCSGGPSVPEITPEQLAQIADLVFNQLGEYLPKFSVCACAILVEKQKKTGGDAVEIEVKGPELNKMTEESIKMADKPDFDPTKVVAKPESDKVENKEEKKEIVAEVVVEAMGAAVAVSVGVDEDGDDGSSAGGSATSETVRDAVVENLKPIKDDLLSKMAGAPPQLAEAAVNKALKKAVEVTIKKLLGLFAQILVGEWNKLIREKQDPKKLFRKAQKVAKTMKDIKALEETVKNMTAAVQSGDVMAAAAAADGVAELAKEVKEDKEKLEQMKKEDEQQAAAAAAAPAPVQP